MRFTKIGENGARSRIVMFVFVQVETHHQTANCATRRQVENTKTTWLTFYDKPTGASEPVAFMCIRSWVCLEFTSTHPHAHRHTYILHPPPQLSPSLCTKGNCKLPNALQGHRGMKEGEGETARARRRNMRFASTDGILEQNSKARVTYMHTYILTYIHTYIHTYLHTYILTYIHTYLHTCIHTYTLWHTHTYIHTPAHTYAYIHTHSSKMRTFCLNAPTLHDTPHTHTHRARHTDLKPYSEPECNPCNETWTIQHLRAEGNISAHFCTVMLSAKSSVAHW
jgi:hypothetical protein